ncbi:MAG TPA: TIGR01777 family oxidoreductase [Myxococcaceae bacterium]|nr:TIGR01777 family oxidoreductase [Myxococcaceae bacterium]
MAEFERYLARSPMPAPARAVFDWHARPGAFERLLPPFERVEVVQRTGGIEVGSRTVLRVWLGPLPRTWVAVHTALEDGASFRDRQESGPFALFEQTHRMIPEGADRSVLEDEVHYRLPGGALGQLAGGGLARARLESLFAYRHALLAADLVRHGALAGPALRVGVGGSHGFIGTALCRFLVTGGHSVTRLPRSGITPAMLEGLDALVLLGGASIGAGRWTRSLRAQIRESRVSATARVVEAMRACARPPRVLLSGSAIGFYGDRGSEPLDETSSPGEGFLAEICQAWEAAARGAESLGARVVLLRTGMVLSPEGGALAKLAPLFRAFAGGRVGSGRQIYSWVALEDVVGAIHFALRTPGLKGPVNLTAPEPVTNGAFTEVLGKVLRRPTPAPVPALAVLAVFGEMGRQTVLASAQVAPRALLEAGFTFRWPGLDEALGFCLGTDRLESAA